MQRASPAGMQGMKDPKGVLAGLFDSVRYESTMDEDAEAEQELQGTSA